MPRENFLNGYLNIIFIYFIRNIISQIFQSYILEDVYANKNAEGILKNRSTRRGAVGIDAEKDAIYAHVR